MPTAPAAVTGWNYVDCVYVSYVGAVSIIGDGVFNAIVVVIAVDTLAIVDTFEVLI